MNDNKVDVVLIGAGIMSAVLGTMLRSLDPSLKIVLLEKLDAVAKESTHCWNNAGTGHAAYCELNYTPLNNGQLETAKAFAINAGFETTLQFLCHLKESGIVSDVERSINRVPHISFVHNEEHIAFLKARHQALSQHPMFAEMQYSEAFEQLEQWMPLMMQARDANERMAATYVDHGTDVDFGSLTKSLIAHLQSQDNFELRLHQQVKRLQKSDESDHEWLIEAKDVNTNEISQIKTDFIFIGAGGGSLPLLQKSGIAEARQYGGFPVSGQWLVCTDEAITQKHQAKVYGKAAKGAPPMSVPHLDTRIIDGKAALLFGPFAGFTTRFLKSGTPLDLIKSLHVGNVPPMLAAGWHNAGLIQYLITEVLQSHEARMDALRAFYPDAASADWQLVPAGKRVQIIKKDAKKGGKIEFGTEVVQSQDKTLAAVLGASPGASIVVKIALQVLEQSFEKRMQSETWQQTIRQMIPTYQQDLINDPNALQISRERTLGLIYPQSN